MYTQDEIKAFADVNNGAISKEVGEGIIKSFNPELLRTLSTAAKPYYANVCLEVAIGNYRAKGSTTQLAVELIAVRYLYEKLPAPNRRQLLKLPILNYTKESIKGWICRSVISNQDDTNYEWEIIIPTLTT